MLISFFVGVLMLIQALPAVAASVNISLLSEQDGVFFQDDIVGVDLFLDTEGESINAMAGKLEFPAEKLKLIEISDGESIINFWLEKPRINQEKINFSGIIPGGYIGKKGKIFSLYFKTINHGPVNIVASDFEVLLADGIGTALPVRINNLSVEINEGRDKNLKEEPKIIDRDPPEPFELVLGQNDLLFDGQWFLSFSSQDKLSGVEDYYVQENKINKNDLNDNWQLVTSPYKLKDQKLTSRVYIKAVDRAGNERISVWQHNDAEMIYKNQRKYIFTAISVIILLSLTLLFLVYKKTKNKYEQKNNKNK